MSKNIEFEQIDINNVSQQDEHKFYFYVKKNSKKISIETDFIYQKVSGIEIKNNLDDKFKSYSNPYDKISNVIVVLDEEQKACEKLRDILKYYDEELKASKEQILGKFGRIYLTQDSVLVSKLGNEYCIFNLDIGWNYYLKKTGELLDIKNSQIVKSKTIKFYSENKSKSKEEKKQMIKHLEFELEFTNDNKTETKIITMSEILNKKDKVDTEIYVRKLQSSVDKANIKKANECNEDELLEFYGKPQKIDVKTLGKLNKIYKNNCYVKFHCDILNGYINKHVVDEESKRKMGLQYIIKAIEIIFEDKDLDFDDCEEHNINVNFNNNVMNKYNFDNVDKKKPVYSFGKRK